MLTLRIRQNPVRMCLVKLTVYIDHLRFHPESEGQSHFIHFVRKTFHAVRKFLRILFPITQRLRIVVTLAEPSVIHNEEFDARIRRTLCKFQKLALIKFKIGSLPAVQKNRAVFLLPLATHNMLTNEGMHIITQCIEAVRGITHYGFRRFQCLAGS